VLKSAPKPYHKLCLNTQCVCSWRQVLVACGLGAKSWFVWSWRHITTSTRRSQQTPDNTRSSQFLAWECAGMWPLIIHREVPTTSSLFRMRHFLASKCVNTFPLSSASSWFFIASDTEISASTTPACFLEARYLGQSNACACFITSKLLQRIFRFKKVILFNFQDQIILDIGMAVKLRTTAFNCALSRELRCFNKICAMWTCLSA